MCSNYNVKGMYDILVPKLLCVWQMILYSLRFTLKFNSKVYLSMLVVDELTYHIHMHDKPWCMLVADDIVLFDECY